MLNTLKRLTKHSVIYGIGNLAVLLPGFILVPLYTRRLSTQEYGILSIVTVFTGMLMFVYELGMISALSRQYYEYNDPASQNKVISTAFTFVSVWATFVTLLLIYLSSPISEALFHTAQYRQAIIVSLFYVFFTAIIFVPQTILRVEERSGLFVALSIARVVLTVIFTVILLLHTENVLLSVFYAMLWATVTSAAIYLFFTYKRIRLFAVSSIDLRQMLTFGIAFFPAALFTWIIDYSNRYILSLYVDMGQVGIYSLGQKISQIVIIAVKAFHLACVPIMFSMAMKEDAKRIFSSIFTYFIFALSVFVLALCLYSRELVLLLSNKAYVEAYKVIPVLAISGIGYGAYLYFITGLSIAKKVVNQPVILAFVALVNVPLNVILIKKIGMMGAALATFLTYIIIISLTFFFSQRHYKIRYEYYRLLKICFSFIIVSALAVAIRLGYPASSGWLFNPVLLMAFFILIYFTGFFKKSEIAYVTKKISTMRGR